MQQIVIFFAPQKITYYLSFSIWQQLSVVDVVKLFYYKASGSIP